MSDGIDENKTSTWGLVGSGLRAAFFNLVKLETVVDAQRNILCFGNVRN